MASFGDHRDRFARFTWFLPLDEPKESNPGSALPADSPCSSACQSASHMSFWPLEVCKGRRKRSHGRAYPTNNVEPAYEGSASWPFY